MRSTHQESILEEADDKIQIRYGSRINHAIDEPNGDTQWRNVDGLEMVMTDIGTAYLYGMPYVSRARVKQKRDAYRQISADGCRQTDHRGLLQQLQQLQGSQTMKSRMTWCHHRSSLALHLYCLGTIASL
jgi:hypothetical protein